MGLFDRKYCSVCGEKIGLLANRKLEDGNLCKNCAKKLSCWFDDRRHSTVEEIKAQLAYREENLEKVKAFNVTRTLGRHTLVVVDDGAQQFMVAHTNDFEEENPDVIDFSQVTGCDFDIDEDRSEEKRRTEDGREVSYNPPRYTWSYDFHMTIRVNHPFFDDMHFDLNSSSVDIEPDVQSRSFMGQRFNPRNHPDYKEYEDMGREIKELFSEKKAAAAAQAAPKAPVKCIHCGATTVPDKNGRCEYCESPLE